MKVGFPAAMKVFPGQKTGLEDQFLQGNKEFTVKMSDVVKEMGNQVPECLPRLDVFLAANMAIAPME